MEWSCRFFVEQQDLSGEAMRVCTAYSDDHLSITLRIPRDSDARIEMAPLVLNSGVSVESLVARIEESGRSSRKDRTVDVLIKIREAEVINVALRKACCEIRCPG